MFIQTEETPNPATLKFIPGRIVMEEGTASFPTRTDPTVSGSPLAQRLFEIEGVSGVFFGRDFISVTKTAEYEWGPLKTLILSTIMEHFTADKPVMLAQESAENSGSDAGVDDSPIVKQIKELIDTRVRPAVQQDGGDIVFKSYEDGVVYLQMQGACAGCPSSTATLKMGIENMLKHYIPEITEVCQIDPDA